MRVANENRRYDMKDQLEASRLRDAEIDKHFADKWHVSKELPRTHERLGYDRVWVHRESGRRWTVEYKHDTWTHKTGNVFIETESVEGEKKGWAYTSCARVLVYYVVYGEYAFVVRMDEIERRLDVWEKLYESKTTTTYDKKSGETYNTVGICVPVFVFRSICDAVVPIYSADERQARQEHVIPMRRGSGVLE